MRAAAEERGARALCDQFIHCLESQSHVVVSVPSLVARVLLEDPRKVYLNYEQLVGSGARAAAPVEQDTERAVVAGGLFGSYADKIVYGVLSLDGVGLASYGHVFLKLRDVAVEDRTTFLECNSYKARARLGSPIPPGYRADWGSRANLALAKLGRRLELGQSVADWAAFLVQLGEGGRDGDEFIEAHIHSGFGVHAVEGVRLATNSEMSRAERMDARLAESLFQETR